MLLEFVFITSYCQLLRQKWVLDLSACLEKRPALWAVSLGSKISFSAFPGVVHGGWRSPLWDKRLHSGYLHIFTVLDPSLPCLLGDCKTKLLHHLPVYDWNFHVAQNIFSSTISFWVDYKLKLFVPQNMNLFIKKLTFDQMII